MSGTRPPWTSSGLGAIGTRANRRLRGQPRDFLCRGVDRCEKRVDAAVGQCAGRLVERIRVHGAERTLGHPGYCKDRESVCSRARAFEPQADALAAKIGHACNLAVRARDEMNRLGKPAQGSSRCQRETALRRTPAARHCASSEACARAPSRIRRLAPFATVSLPRPLQSRGRSLTQIKELARDGQETCGRILVRSARRCKFEAP